eukprot:5948446-Amphidinium_carterae.2
MVYVDDLPLIGPDTETQSFLKTLEAVLQIKHVTDSCTVECRSTTIRYCYYSERCHRCQEHTVRTTGGLYGEAAKTYDLHRTKHVDIQYLHVQHLHHEGALRLHQVGTNDNPADFMTKYSHPASP